MVPIIMKKAAQNLGGILSRCVKGMKTHLSSYPNVSVRNISNPHFRQCPRSAFRLSLTRAVQANEPASK